MLHNKPEDGTNQLNTLGSKEGVLGNSASFAWHGQQEACGDDALMHQSVAWRVEIFHQGQDTAGIINV
jgi:hypothetical protein